MMVAVDAKLQCALDRVNCEMPAAARDQAASCVGVEGDESLNSYGGKSVKVSIVTQVFQFDPRVVPATVRMHGASRMAHQWSADRIWRNARRNRRERPSATTCLFYDGRPLSGPRYLQPIAPNDHRLVPQARRTRGRRQNERPGRVGLTGVVDQSLHEGRGIGLAVAHYAVSDRMDANQNENRKWH